MSHSLVERLAIFRIVIGYLGEGERFGWWKCSFFIGDSHAFLAPIFNRTKLMAQLYGITCAASLIHDERIGIGNVYHLFRLPEEMEQGIHQALHETQFIIQAEEKIAQKDIALEYLRNYSIIQDQVGIGPTRVGNIQQLHNDEIWSRVIGFYYVSFEKQIEILPYFANVT